ncbi:MAG TPA: glycosyltransferase family 1 protein, partial [Stellaceae bacterium]|nr:glycosyltransferase family 1 protein [Stellaceae bacterium]
MIVSHPAMETTRAHIFLDLSRLLWRAERFAPTGIDRVELAYARQLIASERDRLSFVAWWGRLALLPEERATRLVAALDVQWSGGALDEAARRRAASLARGLRLHALRHGEKALHTRAREAAGAVYLHLSHQRLDRPASFVRLKERTGIGFVCLVHDLIPIDHPQYVPWGHRQRHRRRVAAIARLADRVIVNSAGTAAALGRHLAEAGGRLPVLVAPLGLDLRLPAPLPPETGGRPYFVSLSTIEPRKNHALLLNVWQRLAAELGENAPRLVLIGRRGWKARQILAPLRRPGPLARLVEAHDALPDAAVARLLAGARALLHPSFAEGF